MPAVVPAVSVPTARLEELDAAPQYSFAYDVQDPVTGDSKAQYETRNGDIVQGSYSLIEADGTRRIVQYTADPINGFNAVVSREPATAVAAIAAPLLPYAPAIAPSVAAAPILPAAAAPVPAIPRQWPGLRRRGRRSQVGPHRRGRAERPGGATSAAARTTAAAAEGAREATARTAATAAAAAATASTAIQAAVPATDSAAATGEDAAESGGDRGTGRATTAAAATAAGAAATAAGAATTDAAAATDRTGQGCRYSGANRGETSTISRTACG